MAYVISRPAGRWELRESFNTPAGPRSRTLLTFRVLDTAAVDRAVSASGHRLAAADVVAAAHRAGAPVAPAPVDAAAQALVDEMTSGRFPAAPVRRRLAALIARAELASAAGHGSSLTAWQHASPAEHGATLRELLDLTDRLPPSRRGPLSFPPLDSTVVRS